MSIFNQFPWTNFREYNLDWMIRTVQDCKETVDAALMDVSNAVAMYFADHIDTTLSVSGDAADAAATGNKIVSYFSSHLDTTLSDNTKAANAASVGTAIANVQYSIPQLDPTLTSAQAAAPAYTVGTRLTSIENDITNLQSYVSYKTYHFTMDRTDTTTAAITALAGMTAYDTMNQLANDIHQGLPAFICVSTYVGTPTSQVNHYIAYNIYGDYGYSHRVYFETSDYTFFAQAQSGQVQISATAKS